MVVTTFGNQKGTALIFDDVDGMVVMFDRDDDDDYIMIA